MILVAAGLFLVSFMAILFGTFIYNERKRSDSAIEALVVAEETIEEMTLRHNAELTNVLNELKKARAKIGETACDGLLTDGGHHKQWYLEEIAKTCGTTEKWLDDNTERGIPA